MFSIYKMPQMSTHTHIRKKKTLAEYFMRSTKKEFSYKTHQMTHQRAVRPFAKGKHVYQKKHLEIYRNFGLDEGNNLLKIPISKIERKKIINDSQEFDNKNVIELTKLFTSI